MPSFQFVIHVADFYKIVYERYVIRFHNAAVLFNFLVCNNTYDESKEL